uniref:NADH-ubiquinone oxidoreductase chain 3 n=1 Tax=Euspilotus scissus TaxID=694456 RepID=D8WKP3_9COLE|nr:NADH dehydrogenase subunit 3 [Euspilotus scissus]ACZ58576.1 NADH dehydrogenase subunit 3 [Euspilotus scissus]
MMISLILSLLTLIISMIMITASIILAKKSFKDREKFSPFECGFDPMNSPRISFSLHFFLITIIFLIFDVEITLIFPIIKSFYNHSSIEISTLTIFILLILLIGLYHEWNQGALEWIN